MYKEQVKQNGHHSPKVVFEHFKSVISSYQTHEESERIFVLG